MFIPVNGGQGISRPFVVGLILLLVFLGMQSDFVPSRSADSPALGEFSPNGKDSTKERVGIDSLRLSVSALLFSATCWPSHKLLDCLQIILELSQSNEKLEVTVLAPTTSSQTMFLLQLTARNCVWWLQKELYQLQQHLLLLKHAAHQHGVEHSSRLGTMLYDDGFALPGDSNATIAKTESRIPEADSEDLGTVRADTVGETTITHQLPQHLHRTHHQTQEAVSSP